MTAVVLDSGAVSLLSRRSTGSAGLIVPLRREGVWPHLVPSVVLVECLTGHPGRDAKVNRFVKTCLVDEDLPESLARRAAWLRSKAGRGSAVDAIVVASAEPGGVVLTQDLADLRVLASYSDQVVVERP